MKKSMKKSVQKSVQKKLILFVLLLNAATMAAQTATAGLVAGPMLGWAEHRSAMIWLEVSPEIQSVEIKYWEKANPAVAQSRFWMGELFQEFNPLKVELNNLLPGKMYEYTILLDEQPIILPYKTEFVTRELWEFRKSAPDFSFLTGSCAYINDADYDRPGKPYGNNFSIFETMAKTPAAFMLWLGDNIYLREADFSSPYGIAYRYSHDRALADLQRFWAAMPHHAIWDDHDYGNNDADKTFALKNVSRKKFTDYWCEKNYGDGTNGIYSKFSFADCEFFLLDDRWFRSNDDLPDSVKGTWNLDKKMFGDAQIDWLKNSLLGSRATFKFIVTGSQVLNPATKYECFRQYPVEYKDFMDFINQSKISGLLFLTGDRHHSDVIKQERPNKYPLYDITSSSLTAGIGLAQGDEKNNPARVANTLLEANNFAKISVSGEKNKRKLTVEFLDVKGAKQKEFSVLETDLK